MKPEVLEAHMVPMRPETDRGFERIKIHEAEEPCHHSIVCKEVMSEEAFKKLKAFKPGEQTRDQPNLLRYKDELRIWRVVQMSKGASDWQTVTVGTPRYDPVQLGETTNGKVVRSSGLYMRSSSGKIARQIQYGLGKTYTKSGGASRSNEVNQGALADLMKRLGNLE